MTEIRRTSWRGSRTRIALAALVAAVIGVLAPPLGSTPAVAAPSFAVGISDSDADTFSHPAWPGLGVRRARVVVPWDIALRNDARRAEFNGWVLNAYAHGVEPFVTLAPTPGEKEQYRYGGTCSMRAPTRDEFLAGFAALRKAVPVNIISVWNEPNFRKRCKKDNKSAPRVVTPSGRAFHDPACPGKATTDNCGPMAAAFYWRLANAACPACILPAGEFDSTPDDAYWDRYKAALRGNRPKLWSIHPYTDVARFQLSGNRSAPATNSFVKQLGGRWADSHVWLTEVGAFKRKYTGRGKSPRVFTDASQAATTAFTLGLPAINSRITRIYYYNFQNNKPNNTCPVQDRGLVAPVGCKPDRSHRVRAAHSVIANRPK